MADIQARLGQMYDFAGGADTITFTLNPDIRQFQLCSEGFDLEDCTVEVLPIGTATKKTVDIEDGIGSTLSVGDYRFKMRSVTVSGVAAGAGKKIGCYQ